MMILILNGSPNKDSMTLTLTENFIKHSNEEFEILNCYQLNIISCDDCKFCSHKIGCPKMDDMQKVYDALLRTDTLILSSPIYFGAFSNELMKVINRLQRYFAERFVHHHELDINIKRLIAVTTAGSKQSFMFDGAKLTFNLLANLFQVSDKHFIAASDTDNVSPINNTDVLRQIEELKKKMVP
jgi:multimeric flavodoxin WrbA